MRKRGDASVDPGVRAVAAGSRIAIRFAARRLPSAASRLTRRFHAVAAAAAQVARSKIRDLSIVAVGDRLMRRLNRDYHHADETTDVLAFPFLEGAVIDGEVVVCAPCARREARARGLPWETELCLYVAHGVLHLAGEDDATKPGALRMRRLERLALRRAGLPLPPTHLGVLKSGG
jgi:probable rRNA maturation factor